MNNKESIKRKFDFLLGLFLFVLLLPIYSIIFLIIIIEQIIDCDFGPLLISELRVSKGKAFTMYKLNMYRENYRKPYIQSAQYNTAHTYAYLQKDPKSLRRFGKIMKKIYLDELGQLFNILKGDMSFVGPRPLPVGYPENDFLPRKNLKTGLVCFAANMAKNQGDTLVKKSTDDEYLDFFTNASEKEIIKTDFQVIIDGFRAMLKAKGF